MRTFQILVNFRNPEKQVLQFVCFLSIAVISSYFCLKSCLKSCIHAPLNLLTDSYLQPSAGCAVQLGMGATASKRNKNKASKEAQQAAQISAHHWNCQKILFSCPHAALAAGDPVAGHPHLICRLCELRMPCCAALCSTPMHYMNVCFSPSVCVPACRPGLLFELDCLDWRGRGHHCNWFVACESHQCSTYCMAFQVTPSIACAAAVELHTDDNAPVG